MFTVICWGRVGSIEGVGGETERRRGDNEGEGRGKGKKEEWGEA